MCWACTDACSPPPAVSGSHASAAGGAPGRCGLDAVWGAGPLSDWLVALEDVCCASGGALVHRQPDVPSGADGLVLMADALGGFVLSDRRCWRC